MKDLQLCQDIVQLGKSMGADEIEVYYHKEHNVEVIVEKNDLQIPKGDRYEGIGVRVIKDKKMGFATTNLLADESLKATVQGALDLAEMNKSSEYNQLPDPQSVSLVEGILDPKGFQLNIEGAVEHAGKIISTFKEYPKVTIDSASVKGTIVARAIANSRNIALREDKTLYEDVVMCFARDGEELTSFDMEFDANADLCKLNPWKRFRDLAQRQTDSLGASSILSYKGQVILTPSALTNIILHPLLAMIKGDAVVNGMSPLKDKLGEMIASSLLTIVDDPTLSSGYSSQSFDREGVPSARLPLISEGKLKSFIYDHKTALKANTTSTGHSVGDNQNMRLNNTNVVINPGDTPLVEMIKRMDKGIIINRFSGNAEPISGDFSGVVKGGFYVENGQIVKPIKEVMVAGNVYGMLNNLVQISKESVSLFNLHLPHMLFDNVSVTGK